MTREIPLSRLEYGSNVRTEKDEDIKALAKSIEEHDILQPLVVRPKGNKYEIICGHRRYKALCLVGGDIPVPCIIRDDINTESEILKVQLEENIQRKQMSALELVEAFERMKKESKTKLSNTTIAKMLNKEVSWVNNQYFAVNNIEKVYGKKGKEIVRKKKYAAGKIIADLQRKQKEESKIIKTGFTIERMTRVITIRCETKEVADFVVSELGKI